MIVLVLGSTVFGAVEEYGAALMRGLRDRGTDAMLLLPDSAELDRFEASAGGSVGIARYPAKLLDRSGPRQVLALRRWMQRLRPTALHVLDVWPAALVAARSVRPRQLLVTHHTPELPRADSLAGRLWWELGWLARPRVVYTSEADRLTDGSRRPSVVIGLGIDVDAFADPRPALTWPGPQVGTVARLSPQKGHDVLLEAARLVLARRPEVRFVIVGDGELREQLVESAAALGEGVLFTGARSDIPELLASFDVFALPSRFEGLCLAVIEAQAAGVPVVATPVGGIRETVVPGETGTLVPAGDPVALAAAIERVLAEPEAAEAMAAEARRRVRERYAADAMVAATLEAYA